MESASAFYDVDDDGDLDLFIGESEGHIVFYRNDGDRTSPVWTFVTKNYNWIDVGRCSMPTFADIDGDGDKDLFIGEEDGGVNFYRNLGYTPPPQVIAISPMPDSVAPIDAQMAAVFSEPMDESTLNASTVLVEGSFSGAITGSIIYDEPTMTMTFVPDALLAWGEQVTVTITGDVTDIGGAGLDGDMDGIAEGSPEDDFVWSFIAGEEGTPHYGDVSLNDEVTAHDASLVLQHVVGLIQLSPIQRINADVTDDGTVSALDAAMILQHSVGLIEKFPAEGDASPTIADISNRAFALSVTDVIAKVGQRATVPISLNDSNGVFAGKFELAYDSKLLKLIDVSMGEQTAKYSLVHNALPDRVNISFAGSESLKGSGAIVNVTFEVLPTVTSDAIIPLVLADAIINENSRVTIKHGSIAFSPTQTALYQNYPNPFNPDTWIPYQLAEDASVTISIYNIRGQLVRKLRFGEKQAGYYVDRSKAAYWNGRNAIGERVASGVYFYILRAGNFQAIRKMIVIK